MWPNLQDATDLVTFPEEILNGKLHLLCSGGYCRRFSPSVSFDTPPVWFEPREGLSFKPVEKGYAALITTKRFFLKKFENAWKKKHFIWSIFYRWPTSKKRVLMHKIWSFPLRWINMNKFSIFFGFVPIY